MRILFYSSSSTVFGAPRSLINLIDGLKELDPTIELLVVLPSKGKLEAKLRESNASYKIIPHFKWVYSHSTYERKRKENIVISQLWLIKNIVTRLLKNIIYLPKHLVLTAKYRPDVIYVNSSLSPMGAITACILRRKLVWHHRETVCDVETGFFLDFGMKISAKLFRQADLHLHPSNFLLDAYSFLNKPETSYVVYNGVFSRNFIPEFTKRSSDKLTIGVIGRVNRQKGQEHILGVFLGLGFNDMRLKFFGYGEPSYINQLKLKYPSDNVLYEKFAERETIFSEVDTIIVNAKNESFGRVITEAFAYAKPVIGLNSGATPELIRDKRNGFLFTTDSELIHALKTVRMDFLNDKAKLDEYGRNARKDFEKSFSMEQYSMSIHKLLCSLAGQK